MKFTFIEKLIMTVCLVLVAVGAVNMAVAAENETGQYCEANPTACAVDRTASEPNELPTPEQIDWDNHPMYDHGGQPPKNAK